ncbi:MAG: biotin transporter BioY [Sporolactobacillus sp.]
MSHHQLRNFILSALFAAFTAILAQVQIPLPFVPITGQTLAVGLTATILGSRYGALAMIIYAALGAIGLPVFTGMSGGIGGIIGPTGGYIISFIVSAFVTGWILEHTAFKLPQALIANLIGMVITLLIGWIQLKYVTGLSWTKAMAIGVSPFILVGIIKAAVSAWLGIEVRRRLRQAGLLKSLLPVRDTATTGSK